MRRTGYILLLGLLLAAGAFGVVYYAGTASSRELMRHPHPELAWLKREFNLTDKEFDRIVTLHRAYLPACAERCRKIEEVNASMQQLLGASSEVTPQVQALIERRAQLRTECEAEMLRHFLEVSKTMPAEQGRRYLEWVERQTFMRGDAMEEQHRTAETPKHHHRH